MSLQSLHERADFLNEAYGDLDARSLLNLVIGKLFSGRVALTTSFGTESAVLLSLIAEVDRALPVFFLDTGKHFPETIAYRDRIVELLGLSAVETIHPYAHQIAAADPDGTLWSRDPDYCCHLRKVIPLEDRLQDFDCWIAGRKRYHGGDRSSLKAFEVQGRHIQVSPLARWSSQDIERAFQGFDLPRHPLYNAGYKSIGCANCTALTEASDNPRSGRWLGLEKRECGIHRLQAQLCG